MPFIEQEASLRYEEINGKRVPIITHQSEVTLTNTLTGKENKKLLLFLYQYYFLQSFYKFLIIHQDRLHLYNFFQKGSSFYVLLYLALDSPYNLNHTIRTYLLGK